MPPDARRVERFLGTAGSLDTERSARDDRLARQLFRRVLSRDPTEGIDQSLLDLLNTEESVDDFVDALRGSMEWFINNDSVLGAQSESYRRLKARAVARDTEVVPQAIAECIAAYRLILGREPDDSGFDYFLEVREHEGLVAVLVSVLDSDEAEQWLRAADRPSLGLIVLAVANSGHRDTECGGDRCRARGCHRNTGFPRRIDRTRRRDWTRGRRAHHGRPTPTRRRGPRAMNLAVVNNTVPFLHGGAETLADSLTTRLSEAGHVVELVRLPFSWDPPEHIADAMLASQLTNLAGVDRVIALKFPAYLVPHEEKIVWLLHQFRHFYDLWDRDGPHDPAAEAVRELVLRADDRHLAEARSLFANSEVTAARLRRFNGLDAEVLYPPLPNPACFQSVDVGDYIFAGGRINTFKRQLLAVEAMAHTRSGVRLVVAGLPESTADLEALRCAREASGCPDRITIIPRYIDEGDKVDLVNRSLACVYSPIDEDSYGYVTLEGAQASKALITTTDSGGILQLVVDGRSGIVCPPDPASSVAPSTRCSVPPTSRRSLVAVLTRGCSSWASPGTMSFDVSLPEPATGCRPVVFLGAGGHAQVCLDVFTSFGRDVIGYVAPAPCDLGLPHLGTDDTSTDVLHSGVDAFVAVGDNRRRIGIIRRLLEMGISVASCASSSSVVSTSVRLGRGTVVMPGAVVNAGTSLGDGVVVNTSASIDHDGRVGDGAHIGPGSHLAGRVNVGEGAFLGIGTLVIPDRTIGPWVTTGAGTVVVADLLDAGTYSGVPARLHPPEM